MLLPQIDPDIDEAQRKNSERKKFMLKEVHLTKLLSTKARGSSAMTLVKLHRKAEVMPRAVLQKKPKQNSRILSIASAWTLACLALTFKMTHWETAASSL